MGQKQDWISGTLVHKQIKQEERKKSAYVNILDSVCLSVFKAVYAILPKQSFCLPC